MNVQLYVVGFAFDKKREHVLLILKNHPEWQRGKWNGLGGKKEEKESPKQAMVREFREECGISSSPMYWSGVTTLSGPGWEVEVLAAEGFDLAGDARSRESERVRVFRVEDVAKIPPENLIPNLRWLIPLCLDVLQEGGAGPNVPEVRYAR